MMTMIAPPQPRSTVTIASPVSAADEAAQEMLANFVASTGEPTRLPIDPFRIARQLGITVYVAKLEPGTSAMLQKFRGADPVIYVSAKDSLNRQRFSCAHELGHYVARDGQDTDYGYIDKRDEMATRGTDPAERWANSFAAALLMPLDEVAKVPRPFSVVAMSLDFGVSAEAMGYRLRNLGLV